MRLTAGTVHVILVLIFVCHVSSLKRVELKAGWKIYNRSHTLDGSFTLPAGVYSAYNADDPELILRSKNDVNLRWIARDDWNFETQFQVQNNKGRTKFAFLTFDGIDTVANIYLNRKLVGQTSNMFVRYRFDVTEVLEKKNNLTVQITSPISEANKLAGRSSKTPPECPPVSYKGECHLNFLRKMQSSFSSNWTLAAPSMGIWKPVTLEMYDVSVIRGVSIETLKTGNTWKLKGRVYLETSLKTDFRGQLTVHLIDLVNIPYEAQFTVSYRNPEVEFQMLFDEHQIQEWWPNGYGDQKLYYAFIVWKSFFVDENDEPFTTQSQKAIQIGFRQVELVKNNEGRGRTFYLRVNDRPVFVKGTTWIPSHILPEKMGNLREISHLFQAAREANINLIRVWGGGVYESDDFYNLADSYGIMIWHDVMFNTAMYPATRNFLKSVQDEITQNVQRISYHPSVVMWVANNQVELVLAQNWFGTSTEQKRYKRDYKKLFVDTILESLMKHGSHTYLLSTPSNGNLYKDDDYWAEGPQSKDFGDFHHFPDNSDPFDPASYEQARFISQYGFESLPCLTSWKRTMDPNDSTEDLIKHRSHNFDLERNEKIIGRWLPLPDKNSYDYWKGYIYLSQLGQAMIVKTQTEAYRRQRKEERGTMGAVYSQLNDVWVAPSQSSIDFYGNYKILQNWAKEFLAPIAITAHCNSSTQELEVHIVQDGNYFAEGSSFRIIMNTYSWSRLLPKSSTHIFSSSSLLEPSSVKLVAQMPLSDAFEDGDSKTNSFFQFLLLKDGDVLSSTFFFPDAPKNVVGIGDPEIAIRIGERYSCDSGIVTVNFVVTVSKPAIFVFFEVIRLGVSQVRFSENGFIQTERAKTITLTYYDPSCTVVKERNIAILNLNQFMKP